VSPENATHDLSTRRRETAWLAAVLAVCALLYFVNLGSVAFLGKDEPKNAQTAREMLERGDWVTTTLAGEPWYDKPILYYWTALIGYHLFGPGELGARAGPAVAGLLAVYLTFLLGRRLSGGRAGAGILAALILGTGLEFFWFARTAVTDALLACCVTGAMTAYVFAREGVHPRTNLYLAWGFTGLATLAKGPIGLLLPAMVIGTDILISRDWKRIWAMRPFSGGLVLLAVAGPWYALVMWRSGGQFFQDFILHYNVERFATENLPHPGPFYYYLPILLLGPFPWSVFLPGALVGLPARFRALDATERARLQYLLLWVVVPLVFFSFAGSKLPSYLLPTFPALAVLLSVEIREILAEPSLRMPRRMAIAAALFALTCAGLVGGGWTYLAGLGERELGAALPLFGVLGAAAIGAILATLVRQRRAVVWGLEPAEEFASARAITLQAIDLAPGPGQLVAYRFHDNSFYFYADASVEKLEKRSHVEERVEREGSVLCFVRRRDLPDILASRRLAAEELGVRGKIHLFRLSLPPAEEEPAGDDTSPDLG